MANKYFTGKAAAVIQVSAATVTAYDAATTYSLTINGVSISVIAAGGTAATATALAAAWNASTHPYFTPITAVDATDDVTMTADEGGFPFVVTSSATSGTGTFGAVSDTTAATGPAFWDDADNWSTGTVPGDADVIYITTPGARLCWNLDRSADSPAELWSRLNLVGNGRVGLSFSGVATSADGDTVSSDAPEYRSQYLKAAITTVDIEEASAVNVAGGTGRFHLHNTATGASTNTVKQTAQNPADASHSAVCFLFDDADADVYISGGRAGVAIAGGNPGETATCGVIFIDDDAAISEVFISEGVTWTSCTVYGGFLQLNAAATMPTLVLEGGQITTEGSQGATAITVNDGASLISNQTGTIATITQEDGSTVDFSRSGRDRTVTTYNFNGGERSVDHNVLTITNDVRAGRVTETITGS